MTRGHVEGGSFEGGPVDGPLSFVLFEVCRLEVDEAAHDARAVAEVLKEGSVSELP